MTTPKREYGPWNGDRLLVMALVVYVVCGLAAALLVLLSTCRSARADAATAVSGPYLWFDVPQTATRAEFRRRTLDGTLDPGWGGQVQTSGCPVVRFRIGRTLVPFWHCHVSLAGVKDGMTEVRACNTAGCSGWTPEPRVSCECWNGRGGCATGVFATVPASGVCPSPTPAPLTPTDSGRILTPMPDVHRVERTDVRRGDVVP